MVALVAAAVAEVESTSASAVAVAPGAGDCLPGAVPGTVAPAVLAGDPAAVVAARPAGAVPLPAQAATNSNPIQINLPVAKYLPLPTAPWSLLTDPRRRYRYHLVGAQGHTVHALDNPVFGRNLLGPKADDLAQP